MKVCGWKSLRLALPWVFLIGHTHDCFSSLPSLSIRTSASNLRYQWIALIMKLLSSPAVWSACLLAIPVLVVGQIGGLTRFPANAYDPYCAMSCFRSLYSLTLSYSSSSSTLGMMTFTTSSSCWASNMPYLTTLAWCMVYARQVFRIRYTKFKARNFWGRRSHRAEHCWCQDCPREMVLLRGPCKRDPTANEAA